MNVVRPPALDPGRDRGLIAVLVAVGVIVAVARIGIGPDIPAITANPLDDAQKGCDATGEGTELADDGRTLIVDGKGEEDLSGLSISSLECLLDRLDVPQSVRREMYSTRALDGRQHGGWAEFDASWSYHPDDGIDLVITRR